MSRLYARANRNQQQDDSGRLAGASMTPQERAAAIADYANECCHRMDGYREDVEAKVLEALAATRRAALLEARQVAITYGERARDEDLSGGYTSELIAQALDRLAQEG